MAKGKGNNRYQVSFKIKLKENGEVDQYKAQLVTKGYKQKFGIDYKKCFLCYKT